MIDQLSVEQHSLVRGWGDTLPPDLFASSRVACSTSRESAKGSPWAGGSGGCI